MRKNVSVYIFCMALLPLLHAKNNWLRTASGIQYKVFSLDKNKPMPMYGDFIHMHLIKYDKKGKEIFNTRIFDKAEGVEMELKHKPNEIDVTEIFTFMHEGDSAWVRMAEHQNVKSKKQRSRSIYKLYLLGVERRDIYYRQKEIHKLQQSKVDSIAIVQYMTQLNLQGTAQDDYGNFYYRNLITTEKQITVGDTVVMHYIGKFLDNKQFDNSHERQQPFKFVVGAKQVIEGLDKAIRHFNFGDKGIILIPSANAYGANDSNGIPANSVLIFEVEIREWK